MKNSRRSTYIPHFILSGAIYLFLCNSVFATPHYPFPQNIPYPNLATPNHKPHTSLNTDIQNYYNIWKQDFLRESNGNTPGGGYYIGMKGTGGNGDEITTSEAHGYGMIISALMAGYDPQAQFIFDGFYNMYDQHRSTGNSELMSWTISSDESASNDQASATDGDMDIAYALLLANKQWGSSGSIHYLTEAKRIINQGIKVSEVDSSTKRVMLGDWDSNANSTRSSDWMTGHFQAFNKATLDSFWLDVHNTAYALYNTVSQQYSPSAGLIPDFVVGTTPRPANEYFLEGKTDDDYSWNACRTPLRLAVDAVHNDESKAHAILQKINNWITQKTNSNPANIKAGYSLEGTALVNYSSHAFTAPFLAAAAASSHEHQQFINQGWDLLSGTHESYYSDTISLLSMLFISGNWWAPYDTMLESQANNNFIYVNGIGARASTDDGHSAELAIDNDMSTESRWSALGDGEWIEFDLGENKALRSVDLAFYRGNLRNTHFDILAGTSSDNLQLIGSYTSSGQTEGFEEFQTHYTTTRYIRIVGHGNTTNGWNSIIEARFNEDIEYVNVGNIKVSASASDSIEHLPANTLDGSLDGHSRWSALGQGEWIMYDLGEVKNIKNIKIAFYKGDQRKSYFKIRTGKTESNLSTHYEGESSGTTSGLETFNFNDIEARFIKIKGFGNSSNDWNSIKEVEIDTSKPVFKQTFDDMTYGSRWLNMDGSEIVSCGSEHGKCLEVTYTPTSRGSERVNASQPIPASKSYTLNYDVKFDKDFEFVKGGKLPGLAPKKHITGCKDSVPEGWSARMMWGREGKIQPYFYQQDRTSGCGEGTKSENPELIPGQWHALSLRVYVNRYANNSNGFIKVYVDGKLISEHSNLRLRGEESEDSLINKILFSTFHGGSDSSWSPSKKVYAYFDNFAVYPGLRIRHAPGE